MSRRSTGMVLGKFLPPHRGHQYLVDFACEQVDEVTVLVFTLDAEPIPGALRARWVGEMCPRARVVHSNEELPQYPHEHPDFWQLWHDAIRRVLPVGPDFVFASEDYGFELARILGATYVPVDHGRELVPVSGTAVREDPLGNWAFLPEAVRPWYARRVSVFGAESTGKTTLTRDLARHFGTAWVAEYARPLIELQGGGCTQADIPRIARGQMASEEALARQANRVLFTDTDPLLTVLWSEVLFGECPAWVRQEAAKRRYDLTLLLDVDTPFVEDPQRFLPDKREWFRDRCVELLEQAGREYVAIRGDWDERKAAAVAAVEGMLTSGSRPR